jgi:hypothetical protein
VPGDSTAPAVALVAGGARARLPKAELARLKVDLIRETAIERSRPQPLLRRHSTRPSSEAYAHWPSQEVSASSQAKSL